MDNDKITGELGACKLPGQMKVRILRFEPRPGKEDRIDDFLKMMNDRSAEAQPYINKDKMVCEVGFVVHEAGKKLLYWLQILGETPITVDPEIPVLRDANALLQEIFIREERTVLLPQFAIFGQPILDNILDYIRVDEVKQ